MMRGYASRAALSGEELVTRNILPKGLSAVVATLLLASCVSGPSASRSSEGKLYDRQGVDVILSPADTQSVYFKDLGSQERYCRSPEPDTASTFSEGVSVGSPLGGGRGVGEDAARGALSLGGRNPASLISRELMYRACELSLNLNADTALTLQIYERFLRSLEKITKYQTGTGVAAKEGAAADTRAIPPLTPPVPSVGPNVTSPGSSSGRPPFPLPSP